MVRNHAITHEATISHERANTEDESVEADERAPFVSMLNKAEGSVETRQIARPVHEIPSHKSPPFYTQSSSEACSKLRSLLPEYDVLLSTLSENGAWWSSFRHKVEVICHGSYEDLAAFAARVYTSSDPAELGMLVVAYARSTGHSNHLYGLVDRLAVPDSAHLMLGNLDSLG
ncbi:hypothetical protein FVER53590_13387 [Fusarium verticillioides]|nr:hypothetical protein FVER53590_13387 [Fusarium verticillioides]